MVGSPQCGRTPWLGRGVVRGVIRTTTPDVGLTPSMDEKCVCEHGQADHIDGAGQCRAMAPTLAALGLRDVLQQCGCPEFLPPEGW
jgi:hypothetical protein